MWKRINYNFPIFMIFLYYANSQDTRCYLENGGSAESFFISEDIPVGSFIGSLRIFGDAGELGNIDLRLKELDSPVSITPFSKNLTLTRQLDKEGIAGPSSVLVTVICERKRASDPSFVIPVNIRVTDANDNAPQFINAPYLLNASEVTVIGTRVLQGIKAVDADQQGPFSTVQYSVLPGLHSDHFAFVNGLEGTLILRKALDYETLSNFTITIRAQDQGNPPQYSDTTVFVNVIDADDQNPKFVDERYTATLAEKPIQGTRLRIFPREISAYDQDVGIKSPVYYSFNSDGPDYRYFEMKRETGSVFIKRSIPDDDFLQLVTLVVRATQYDNADRYALATLTISRVGTPLQHLQFLHDHYVAAILENVPLGSVLLTVVTNKPHDKRLKYWLSGHKDTFNVTSGGDLVLVEPLDFETIDYYGFLVHVTDGFVNTSATVNITVLNVNDWDPRFRYPQYEFFLPDVPLDRLPIGTVVGKVEAADGDRVDHISLSLRGPDARLFSVDDSGEIFIKDLSKVNSTTAHLVAVATDSGLPPRQASVPVIIHLPETVVTSARRWVTQNTNFAVLASFIAVFSLLAVVIVVLILYIQKYKKNKQVGRSKLEGFYPATNDKPFPVFGKIENPVFNEVSNYADVSSTISNPYTATVKSNVVQRPSPSVPNRGRRKVAPVPPQVPSHTPPGTPTSFSTAASSPQFTNSPSPTVGWPHGSIPRTVKKLSWDDETDCYHRKTRLDPDVSITPLVTENRNSDHMNLTVYF